MNWFSLALAIFGIALLLMLWMHSIFAGIVKRKRSEFALLQGKITIKKVEKDGKITHVKSYHTTDNKSFDSLHNAHKHQIEIQNKK